MDCYCVEATAWILFEGLSGGSSRRLPWLFLLVREGTVGSSRGAMCLTLRSRFVFILVRLGVNPPVDLVPSLGLLEAAASTGGKTAADWSASLTAGGHVESGLTGSGDLVFIDNGMPPISRKVWQRIRDWNFVDMAELVNKEGQAEDEAQLLQQCDGKLVLVHSLEQLKRKSKEGLDIMGWLEAYAVLVAVAGQAQPDAVPHLMAFQVRVIRAARVKGSNWREFDRQYRRKAAARHSRDWSVHDADLWDRFVLTAAAAAAHVIVGARSGWGEQRHGGQKLGVKRARDSGGKGRSTCYPYNFERQCARTAQGLPCQYDHICYSCGDEGHIHLDCPQAKDRPPKKK